MNVTRLTAIAAVAMLALGSLPLLSQKPEPGQTVSQSQLIERGQYLVDNVGLCADCHSPRNEKGEYIREKWLQGSPIFFKPTVPLPSWAETAPRIAGLPGWTDEEAMQFLTTGKNAAGNFARIPMPAFRFSREDAQAITAYLRSLGKETSTAEKH